MANCRRLLVIFLLLASLQTIHVQPASAQTLVLTVATVGGKGVFTTIQQAINAVPVNNQKPVVINVKPGTYREKVIVPAEKPFITLVGSDANNTIITWNDSAKSTAGTDFTATVTVLAADFIAR